MRNTERLYDRVIEKMDMTCDMEDEELQELIHEVLEEASKEEFIPLQEKIRISKELFNAFRKLDILQELIEDDGNHDQWDGSYFSGKSGAYF